MLVFHLLVCILVTAVRAAPEVKVGRTTISGRDITANVEFFGGIPFAEPPVGALRLRKPVLKVRLNTTTFNATAYGKSCLQPPLFGPPSTISEDCLTISVFRPAGLKSSAKLPVLLWTYGGAFIIGASDMYNASNLVQRGIDRKTPIIYVNFNYRLGPLGFPQGQEAHDRRSLNLALEDQIAALEWVQTNIHFFGGDKNKVTIFGESAGAMMTGTLYLSSKLERLARGAILESGSSNGPSALPAAANELGWQGFVARVPSCASVATSGKTFDCLQNTTAEEISAAVLGGGIAFPGVAWGPTLDAGRNSLYPDLASRLYAKGRFARLPFIAGTNRDEGTLFASQQPLTDADFKAMVAGPNITPGNVLDSAADKVLELYPADPTVGSPYGTGDELFGLPASYKRHASLMGDTLFDAPRRMWSQAAAKFGVKNYGYHFTDPQGVPAAGVPHGAEIAYVYGQVPPTAGAASQNLSVVMMDYWISFTVSLDPNDGKGVERPKWPQYKDKSQVLLQLEGGNTTVVKDDFREEAIGFLNKNAELFNR
ncbi:hypothetical protein EST38_g10583 [Candolleomyces aberdarensis]|uniref:Carboxylic ester hydrolase n=1 Tax=Candolleomyces aberdarensis TaxID=2316362 RepID=A0A4Q2D8L7_9AGAR|nr:hypothetical protein EST38_g10583 [Candolleomyces aberdarensis]